QRDRYIFPSWNRRGGCAIKKMLRSDRSGADGVVRPALLRRPADRNGSIFIDVAATPPVPGGELPYLSLTAQFESIYPKRIRPMRIQYFRRSHIPFTHD